MKPLTTQQRNAIYREALRIISNDHPFICNNIYFAMRELYGGEFANYYDPTLDELYSFPEIKKHKPNITFGDTWFAECIAAPRIPILQQAIAETEPEYEVKYVVEAPKPEPQ